MATISGTLRINDAFSNTLNKFNSGVQRGMAATNRLKTAMSGASGGFGSMRSSASSAGIGLKQIIAGSVFGRMISSAAGLATSGIRSFIGELNDSTVAWSTFEGNMQQMGKSPTEINSAKKALQKFAQDTIYSSSDMASTYSQLAAVGTKNTAQLVKGFGGLAASANDPKQAMKTLSEQATQMAAKPMVQWQDFRLMLDQAPAGISAVAKAMGKSSKQLVADVQNHTVKTQDFLDAVAKTGTNANFSKMATQYKTVGQAVQGLVETLSNNLQPTFQKVSQIGIDAVTGITDSLGELNWDKIGDKLLDEISRIQEVWRDFMAGFGGGLNSTGATNFFTDIRENAELLFKSLSGNKDISNFVQSIGSGAGQLIGNLANGISNLVLAISKMNPNTLKVLAVAFLMLKNGAAGLKLTAIVVALQAIGKLDPGQIKQLAGALTALATGIMAFKGVQGVVNAVLGIRTAFSKLEEFIENFAADIETGFAAAFIPVLAIIELITAAIIAAVYAWQTNFMGFRDFMSAIFNNLGTIFQPLMTAFQQLGQALGPLIGVFGKIFTGAVVVVIMAIAFSIALLADTLTVLISIITIAIYAVRMFVHVFYDLGKAIAALITGNLSGLKSAFNDVKTDAKGIGDAWKTLNGKSETSGMIAALSQIDAKAKDTKASVSDIKLSNTVANNNAAVDKVRNFDVGKQSAKVQVQPQFQMPGDPIAKVQKQLESKPVKAKVSTSLNNSSSSTVSNLQNKLNNNPLKQKLKVDTSSTKGVNKKIQDSVGSKSVKAKIARPKVPAPKMPKLKTLRVKVARPKVPAPRMPKLKTIAAPKVAKPSMAGVVAAVRAGSNSMASAMRSGTSKFGSIVSLAVNHAAAVARSGVGPMHSAGVMIGAGLASGMRSQVGAVAAAANALVAQANRAARAKAQIHSPSRLFAEVGDYIGQGMVVGMNGTQDLVASAGAGLIDAAMPNVPSSDYDLNLNGSSGDTQYDLTRAHFSDNPGTTNDNHSSSITIENGAIQINSTGNAKYDAEELLDEIETALMRKQEKSLS